MAKVDVERVRAAIQQLPVEFREMILLREYEGLSYQETAEVPRCPAGTIMSRRAGAASRSAFTFGKESATRDRG
jgi:RNA polymerase sigma-70 factor (ECF subfamily)